jgi:sn-glycerol 3-phosphate transport system ATP-binding protein
MNLLRGQADGSRFTTGGQTLPLPAPAPRSGELILGLRPEHALWAEGGVGAWELRVDVVETLGAERLVYCRLGETLFTVRIEGTLPPPQPGEHVPLRVAADRVHWFDARSGQRVG